MWFFLSVMGLWGSTALMGRWDPWTLPPILDWSLWTCILYLCGASAMNEPFTTLIDKLGGMFGYSLITAYYLTQSTVYLKFLPFSADHPDLWGSVFLVVNLIGPMALVTVGCIQPAIQRRGAS